MKRFHAISAFLLALVMCMMLVACTTPEANNNKETQAPGTQAPATDAPGTQAPGTEAPGTEAPGTEAPAATAPEGYQIYNGETFTFAYPENWTKTDGSVVILMNESGAGNNITVAYEPKTDMYVNMTTETFGDTLGQILTTGGITPVGATVEQITNANGVKITKIHYTAEVSGVSMAQTIAIFPVADNNYVVTITELSEDASFVATVIDSIAVA